MEKDDEIKGTGNSYDFGARFYDPRVGRWLSTDPMEKKHARYSPYIGIGNNPIIYKDPDGEDIVYYDENGTETSRTASNTEFKTYVRVATQVPIFKLDQLMGYSTEFSYQEVQMPNRIVTTAPGDDWDYNQYDHIIAVETYIFNRNKASGSLPALSNLTPDPDGEVIQDLDPNVVKTVMLKETRAGKIEGGYKNGDLDVMQVNVTGDWSPRKSTLGLKEGGSVTTAQQSIKAGIMFLYWKGITVSKTKDENGKTIGYESEWVGGTDWMAAVKSYNGGGDPQYMEKVAKHYEGLLRGMTDGALKNSDSSSSDTGSTTTTTTTNSTNVEQGKSIPIASAASLGGISKSN